MVLPWRRGWSPQPAAPSPHGDGGCPPRGTGIPRELRGQKAGFSRRQGAGPRRRLSSSRSSKVGAECGKTALTVGLFILVFVFHVFCTSVGTKFSSTSSGKPHEQLSGPLAIRPGYV